MTKFYIVRHGQTDYNKEHRIQGRLNIPLNEAGIEQAKNIADSLENVNFDVIYYSPLVRAKQTADEIAKKHGGAEYIEVPEIVERDFGDMKESRMATSGRIMVCGIMLWNLGQLKAVSL